MPRSTKPASRGTGSGNTRSAVPYPPPTPGRSTRARAGVDQPKPTTYQTHPDALVEIQATPGAPAGASGSESYVRPRRTRKATAAGAAAKAKKAALARAHRRALGPAPDFPTLLNRIYDVPDVDTSFSNADTAKAECQKLFENSTRTHARAREKKDGTIYECAPQCSVDGMVGPEHVSYTYGIHHRLMDSKSKDKKTRTNADGEANVPRVANAYLLYQREQIRAGASTGTGDGGRKENRNKLLPRIAEQWKNMGVDGHRPWERIAEMESAIHEFVWPEYRFNPRSKKGRGAGLAERAGRGENARAAAADDVVDVDEDWGQSSGYDAAPPVYAQEWAGDASAVLAMGASSSLGLPPYRTAAAVPGREYYPAFHLNGQSMRVADDLEEGPSSLAPPTINPNTWRIDPALFGPALFAPAVPDAAAHVFPATNRAYAERRPGELERPTVVDQRGPMIASACSTGRRLTVDAQETSGYVQPHNPYPDTMALAPHGSFGPYHAPSGEYPPMQSRIGTFDGSSSQQIPPGAMFNPRGTNTASHDDYPGMQWSRFRRQDGF